jgi:hypothetical protein
MNRFDQRRALQSWPQFALKLYPAGMNPPDPELMMSLDKFMEQTGLSPTTIWRWRKKGMLTTVNICGRRYILRSEIARFNERTAAGEFAKELTHPRARSKLAKRTL